MAQHVCITGANRGIGAGFVRAYLQAGATVYGGVRSIRTPEVEQLRERFPQRFIPFQIDVADTTSVQKAFEQLQRSADRIDILINNAGIAKEPNEQKLSDISEADILEVFNVNTIGPLRCVQAAISLLRNSQTPRVIFISSSAASISGQGGGRGVPYCVSKGALNMLAKLLYFHLKDEGITSAAIHPGWVQTDMGGSQASLTVDESVASMLQVIENLDYNSPNYIDYRGEALQY
ncbi:MAG: SDR family oxidoreductase [Spirochaetaceae bacterium]|nr:SDR family oxidoreductase [Spirochaetaceae bacterium]